MTTANDNLRDLANERAVYLRGYGNRLSTEAMKLIQDSESDLVAQLYRIESKLTTSPLTIARTRKLLADATIANTKAYNSLETMLLAQGTTLAQYEAMASRMAIAEVTATPVTGVSFILNQADAKQGRALTWVDTAKFDAAFQNSKEYYIGAGGTGNTIRNRYAAFKEFMTTGVPIEVSTVTVNKDGSVSFDNGRHRYSVLRDGGNKVVPMALSEESIANAKEVGYLAEPPSNPSKVSVSFGAEISTPETIMAAVNAKPFEGKFLSEWVEGMSAARIGRVSDAIRMGVVEGQTIDDIVRRLIGTKAMDYADGILDTSRRSARALAITYVSHVSNEARNQVYSVNVDIVKGVQWVSTLDGRTSAICQSRDGEVFPVDSGPRPPAHINCRSTTTPILKSWKELGVDMEELPESTRSSMDGQISEKQTYQTWLKGKDTAFQDHVLGKAKAEAFRSGKMTLDRFVDLDGHQLTLEQLKLKK